MADPLPHVLTLVHRFPTSPERTFALWTGPALLLQWSELRGCDVDLRLGGHYRVDFPAPRG